MEIVCKTTVEFSTEEWSSYTDSFNQVFGKEFTVKDFEHKYLLTIEGLSYHSLLKDKNVVVGGCTIMPYEYMLGNSKTLIGLAVDGFIVNEYRRDPLLLYSIYKRIKQILIKSNIKIVLSVPNDAAYQYWKSIVKWKDIGTLKYYALPVRVGNLFSRAKVLNIFSRIFAYLLIHISSVNNSTERIRNFRINRKNSVLEDQRYTSVHTKVTNHNTFFSYRIVMEDNVNTCYLIDFYNINKEKKDARSLFSALKYIVTNEKIDLVLFIGVLDFFQFSLIKVPYKLEPRHLYLMGDILIKQDLTENLELFSMSNWDFGLFNYDVR